MKAQEKINDAVVLRRLFELMRVDNVEQIKQQLELGDEKNQILRKKVHQLKQSVKSLINLLSDLGIGKIHPAILIKQLKSLAQSSFGEKLNNYCNLIYPIIFKLISLLPGIPPQEQFSCLLPVSSNILKKIFNQEIIKSYQLTPNKKQQEPTPKTPEKIVIDKPSKSKSVYQANQSIGKSIEPLFNYPKSEKKIQQKYSLQRNVEEDQIENVKVDVEVADDVPQANNLSSEQIAGQAWQKVHQYLNNQIEYDALTEYFQMRHITDLGNIAQKLKEQLVQLLSINEEVLIMNDETLKQSVDLSWEFTKCLFSEKLEQKRDFSQRKYQFFKKHLSGDQNFPGILVGKVGHHPYLQIYHKLDIKSQNESLSFFRQCSNNPEKLKILEDKLAGIELPLKQKVYVTIFQFCQEIQSFQDLSRYLPQLVLLINQLQARVIVLGEFEINEGHKNFYYPQHNRFYLTSKIDKKRYEGFKPTFFGKPIMSGGFPYFCPSEWMRISLLVTQDQQEFNRKFGNWRVGYQGTKNTQNLFSILVTGFRAGTGCYSRNETVAYFTPSIQYAGMYFAPHYDDNIKKWVLIVIQVRIDPQKIFNKGRHTLKNKFVQQEHFMEYLDDYQWLMKGKCRIRKGQREKNLFKKGYDQNLFTSDGVVPYGIMIKYLDEKPITRYKQQQQIQLEKIFQQLKLNK